MAHAADDVLFFGTIIITLTELRVCGPAFAEEMRRLGASLRVRATVSPLDPHTHERLGASPVSGDHALPHPPLRESLFLPVLLQSVGTAARLAEGLGVDVSLETRAVGAGRPLSAHSRTARVWSLRDLADGACAVATVRLPPDAWGAADHGAAAGVEVDVMVRAVDLSPPLRRIAEAEAEGRRRLRRPPREPRTRFAAWAANGRKGDGVPAGVPIPLDILYDHYRGFFERYYNRTLRPSPHVLLALRRPLMGAPLCLDLRPELLGDAGLAPVLAALAWCPSLVSLRLDENAAGDDTALALSALFASHRHLREVSVVGNRIYEGGAMQLMRLARRNRSMLALHATGNGFSAAALRRLGAIVAANREALESDAFHLFSASYRYATAPSALPGALVRRALALWAMLAVVPLASEGIGIGIGDGDESCVPMCAKAPLLREVMRTVYRVVCGATPHPAVRGVFADVETPLAESAGCGVAIDVEAMYASSFMRLVIVTMRGMGRVLEWDDAAVVLRGIGRQQRALGVLPEDYRLAVRTFVEAVTTVCGKGHADAESAAALLQCLAVGLRTANEVEA